MYIRFVYSATHPSKESEIARNAFKTPKKGTYIQHQLPIPLLLKEYLGKNTEIPFHSLK